MASDIVRIRRYPNRRLYDRSTRRYVTLQEIEELVRTGRTVEVRDSKSDEDLTRQILTQILLERHPEKMDLFPIAMLHGLLQTNDMVVEFWRGCLRQSLATLERLQAPTAPGAIPSPLTWMSSLWPGLAPAPAPAPEPPPQPPAASPADSDSDSESELARRLAELEQRLHQLEGDAAQPRPPQPRPRKPVGPGPA